MKSWLIAVAIAFLVTGTANSQNAQVTYKFTNTEVLGEDRFAGDILIERNNGTADLIPFVAEGRQMIAGGSPFVPSLANGQVFGTVTYDPPPGDEPPPGQTQGLPAVVVPLGVCLVTTAYMRNQCNRDCSATGGVESWNSGYCGHSSTCACKDPPPPPPPAPCAGPNPAPACENYWPQPAPANYVWGSNFSPFSHQYGYYQLLIQNFVGSSGAY